LTANDLRMGTVVCIVLAFCLSGCASDVRYRTAVATSDELVCQFQDQDIEHCKHASTEVHQVVGTDDGYTLHFVEFDDEGAPHEGAILGAKIDSSLEAESPSQMNAALRQIREILSKPEQCVELVIFTHGWQNNAKFDNPNVESFRDFLRRIAAVNSKGPTDQQACFGARVVRPAACAASAATPCVSNVPPVHRKLVGIYVGWRGQTFTWPLLEYASFWDRKAAAERVARGSVRELFGRLRDVAGSSSSGLVYADTGQPAPRMRTYVIGHSFGADVVYQSLAQSLVDSLVYGVDDQGSVPAVAPRFIDMVVLVNPAVEAQRFDPVFRAAKQRRTICDDESPKKCTPPYQAPLMAIFTSENDRAT